MPGAHESSDMALITSGKTISFTVHVIKIQQETDAMIFMQVLQK